MVATLATVLITAIALSSVALAGKGGSGGPAGDGPGGPFRDSEKLRKALTVDGISDHLERLQAIADANGGNRASGFGGHDASVDYVVRTLSRAGWRVDTQEFNFDVFFQDAPSTFEQISPTAETYVEDTDYATTEFSGSGDVTAELVAIDLILLPTAEPSSTSGCEDSDFAGTGVAGKIALIQRGTCTFREKVDNAAEADAVGVVLFNEGQPGRSDVIFGTLGGPNAAIPTVDTSFALGEDLSNGVATGATGTTVHIQTTTHSENRTTENVLAETAVRRSGQRRDGRRAPGLGPGGPGDQRQRLGLGDRCSRSPS